MSYQIKDRIIVAKKAIELFVALCPVCELKRSAPKKAVVVKTISSLNNASWDLNERVQVDLIEIKSTPDGCKKSLQNLRPSPRRSIKNKTTSSNKVMAKKNWKYKTAMSEQSSLPIIKTESEDHINENDDSVFPVDNLSTFENDSQASSIQTEGSSESPYDYPEPLFHDIKKPAKRKRRTESASALLMKYVLGSKKKHDDIDKFFIAVAATVKKLSAYNQAVLKSKIYSLVSEAEINELNEEVDQNFIMVPEGSTNTD